MTTLVLCRVSSARLDRPLSLRPHDVAPMCVWHAGTGDGDVFEVVVKMCLFQRIRFTSGGGARTIHQTSNGSRARRRSRTAGLLNSTSGVGEPVSTPRGCQTSDRVLASQGREDQPCGFDRRSGVTHTWQQRTHRHAMCATQVCRGTRAETVQLPEKSD